MNCTFVENTGTNNIIQNSGTGFLRIYTSVFSGNTAPTPISAGGTLVFEESLIPVDVDYQLLCSTCTSGNPIYVDAANDNYALTAASPGVDEPIAGGYVNPYEDIVGNTRVVGSSIDMGAYEYQGAAGITENNAISVTVFPNPTSSVLNIQMNETIEQVFIYNSLGALMQTEMKNIFSVENLASGMYVLQIKTNNHTYSKRFIKE
jgi:hypothetical protein